MILVENATTLSFPDKIQLNTALSPHLVNYTAIGSVCTTHISVRAPGL